MLIACSSAQQARAPQPASAPPGPGASPSPAASLVAFTGEDLDQTVNRYCVVCHNEASGTANLGFDTLDVSDPASHPAIWEDVVTKLRMGTMPPAGMPRPDEATYAAAASWIERELDGAWLDNPNPGRIDAVHRLNRIEYNNAIRDLFALDIDLTADLPGDETADGAFDNTASLLQISTTNLNRYLTVARKVTRLAVGLPPQPTNHIERLHTTLIQQDQMSTRLPLGSRGGTAVDYYFPADGEYSLKITLQRHYQEYFRGAGWPQWVDVRLDGELLRRFTYGGGAVAYRPATMPGAGESGFAGSPEWEEYMTSSITGADSDFEFVAPIEAGAHTLGVSFVRDRFESEDILQPPQWTSAWTEQDDDERYLGYAQLLEVFITGPFEVRGPTEDTPSRRAIFVCEPQVEAEEEACAREILTNMATRAYRRPVTQEDLEALLEFFQQGRERGEGFDGGIQMALERMLVDPDFLFRIYRDPPVRHETASSSVFIPTPATDPYELTDLEVASRLSFFLWSSIPDDDLLELASEERLVTPDRSVLREQVERMLADPRTADALVEGFVAQWLNLRLLTQDFSFLPEDYPDGDGDLIAAFPRETEEFVRYTLREDRSVVELLDADYSFINERLARHYGIPDVYGSHFRKVELPDLNERGGILGHAGILALSSYPTRTSPVLRGKWLLDNILGTPPDPPPPNVDTTLKDDSITEDMSIRERLAAHRRDPVCSTCHSRIDPLGFSLEGYGVLGNYRELDERGNPVDNIGMWPSGREINGMVGLRELLLDQREQFVATVTAKMMAYALGRGVEYYDKPTIRKIVRQAAENDYRWSSIILGIVESPAFLMRARADEAAAD
jgi:mono/diheme cytochrome c family protein